MSSLTLITNPDKVQQASGSTMPWDIEFAAHVAGGESISAPTATLTDLTTQTAHAGGILSVATTSSTVVRVTLQNLTYGHRYRLVTRGTVSASKTPAVYTNVEVPF